MPNQENKGYVLTEWNPEDQNFWNTYGRKIANKNLWQNYPVQASNLVQRNCFG